MKRQVAALAALLLLLGSCLVAAQPAPSPEAAPTEPSGGPDSCQQDVADAQEECCKGKVDNSTDDLWCLFKYPELFPEPPAANGTANATASCEAAGAEVQQEACCAAKVQDRRGDAWCSAEFPDLFEAPSDPTPPLFGATCGTVTPSFQEACCQQDAKEDKADPFCKATYPALYPAEPAASPSPAPVVPSPSPVVPSPSPEPPVVPPPVIPPPVKPPVKPPVQPQQPEDCSALGTPQAVGCCQAIADAGDSDAWCMREFPELWGMEDPNGGGGGGGNVINTPTSDCQTAGGPWAQQKCCQQKVDNDEYDAFCSFEFPAMEPSPEPGCARSPEEEQEGCCADKGERGVEDWFCKKLANLKKTCEGAGDADAQNQCCADKVSTDAVTGDKFCTKLIAASSCVDSGALPAQTLCCDIKRKLNITDGFCEQLAAAAAAAAAPAPAPTTVDALPPVASPPQEAPVVPATSANVTEQPPEEVPPPSAAPAQAAVAGATLLGALLMALLMA